MNTLLPQERQHLKERKSKRHNRVSPTESRGGSRTLVSQPQGRQNSLEGRGWDKKRMPSCNGRDRGSKFAPDRNVSRLVLGLARKKPNNKTELNGKLDVRYKLGKRTKRAPNGLEPD
jgi:hypothetical protein